MNVSSLRIECSVQTCMNNPVLGFNGPFLEVITTILIPGSVDWLITIIVIFLAADTLHVDAVEGRTET